MVEARFYELEGKYIHCRLCAHGCILGDGCFGKCGVRYAKDGILHTTVYAMPCTAHADPIEKKPLFHFLPGSRAYSIATVGCNLRCEFCQNHEISQIRGNAKAYGFQMMPERVVWEAINSGCDCIAYTYTEPTVFLEYALDISLIARREGLRNVFVSNGFMSEESVNEASKLIDAANIDLKSFSDDFYKKYCGARLDPVLKTIEAMVAKGVWVELTTLVIPTLNDNEEDIQDIAGYILKNLGAGVPWHISGFHPDHNMAEKPKTDPLFLQKAAEIGRREGLRHVYTGNMRCGGYEDTICPNCKKAVIKRSGYEIIKNILSDGGCGYCKQKIEGVWK